MEEVIDCEKKKIRELNSRWNIGLSIIESVIDRHNKNVDPVTRHLLLADKLCMLIDISLGVLTGSILMTEHLDDDIIKRADVLAHQVQNQLQDLMDWIQNPIYSPDHPFRNNMMQNAAKHLTKMSEYQKVDKLKFKN